MGLPSRARARGRAPAKDMAWVPGGGFLMGSDEFYPEERPARRVEVDGFWVDDHPVTVAEFGLFVSATRYVTVAERPLDPADYLDADPALLQPGSLVFQPTAGPVDLRDVTPHPACLLYAAQPAGHLGRGEPGPRRARRAYPAPGDQGRLSPVRPELLPEVPPRGAPGRGDRHLHLPPGLPLHYPDSGPLVPVTCWAGGVSSWAGGRFPLIPSPAGRARN